MVRSKYEHRFVPYEELEICKDCGGAEGSLTSTCPGVSMTTEQADSVYEGHLDFRGDSGWVKSLSPSGSNLVRAMFYRKDTSCTDDIYTLFPEEIHSEIKGLINNLESTR